MKIMTRLILSFLLVALVPVAIVGYAGTFVIGRISSVTQDESTAALQQLGKEAIQQQALSVARQVELYLQAHPELATLPAKELEADQELAVIAVQPVGKTGYTALYDSDAVTHFHTNPALIGADLRSFANTRQAFWGILEASLGGKIVNGYYQWQEADGSWRDKYMSCVPVGKTRFRIAATTYLDEFSQPVKDTTAKISGISKTTTQGLFGVVGIVGFLALLVAIVMAVLLVRPINRISRAAQQLSQGKLDYEIPASGSDEIGQLAQVFNQMAKQLRELFSQTNERAATLERRTRQLQAEAEVGRAVSSILSPQELLQRTVDLICDHFDFYYAGMFLLDEEQRFAVLRAGRGEAGRIMLERGHKLEVGGRSMIGQVCADRQARIASDVSQADMRFANPVLPDTRSEIALPLALGDRILGALTVQSTQTAAFDEQDVATLEGVADHIAIALENARLFTQTQASLAENKRLVSQVQASLQETTALYEASQFISLAQDSPAVFQAIVDRVLKPDIDLCMLILFDPYQGQQPQQLEINQVWVRAGQASASASQPGSLAGKRFDFARFPLHDFLHPNHAQVTRESQVPVDAEHRQMWDRLGMQALAFLPLQVGARWIGELVLGTRQTAEIFTEDTLKPYQAMVTQAAVAIENHRLFASSEARLHELSELYRSVTGKAWGTFLQTQPGTTEYEFKQVESAGGADNVWRIPLKVRGQDIGLVELESDRQTWSEQERALVEAVITQTALALDGARLFEQTQRLAGRERLINEITGRIRASTSVPGILQTAARELATAMNVPHAVARISLKAEEPRDSRQGSDGQTA
jgi:GAF domain-containing protein/HAMP domain-containing protein